jgi:serine/threonine protein phosphatase PrpC
LNLGDSGYILYRPSSSTEVSQIFRSKEQLYGYDFPFQCGTRCDLPTEAYCLAHSVSHNDIIVLGSDGVFDNVFDKDILDCFKGNIKESNADVDEISECISRKAERNGSDEDYESPF